MPIAASSPYRLPRNVAPTTYRLRLIPDLEAATFSGTVEIDIEIHEAANTVVMNAAELEITDAIAMVDDGRTFAPSWDYDEALERVTFTFAEPLSGASAELRLSFTGILNDQLHGFYRSTFVDDEGKTRTIATTQFEAADARRAFPCFDEPDRKATFEVTLVVPEDLASYSNSPVVLERSLGNGTREVVFGPTMKMSTYLVAFVVGPFEQTPVVDVDGIPLRIVYPKGKAHLAPFSLDIGAFALRFFAEYFDIAYPGDKLDLIAIPDFAFGAMENLGCVTFRETALLVDPNNASRVNLERIVDVVAHEIAHMWFGDLVTMGWWEGIWLNEAFATFMEMLCTDAFKPSWERWTSFGLEKEMALAIDGLHNTRAIEYEVQSPEDADGMFDILTYEKGGSVLRMLQQYLGETAFRDGVRLYLKRHAYANTVTTDLWDAIEEASGKPVREIMNTWILQGGHPLITVEDGVVSQSPFSYGPPLVGTESAIGTTWQVPLLTRNLASHSVTATQLGSEPVNLGNGPGSVFANAGGAGVYRVAYGPADAAVIAASLSSLAPLERAVLMNDALAATQANKMGLGDFFNLAANLGDDDEPATWGAVIRALALLNRVASPEERGSVAAATVSLLLEKATALGFEPRSGESERTPGLRGQLIGALGTIGHHQPTIEEAIARFNGQAPLNADLEPAILEIVGSQNRPGAFDHLLNRFKNPANPQQEMAYLYALAGFPDSARSAQVFEMARTEVRSQNAPFLIAQLLANRTTGPETWVLIEENFAELLERFPTNSHPRMLSSLATLCGDPAMATRATKFMQANPLKSGQKTVLQALERLQHNVAFAERVRGTIVAALTTFGDSA